MELDIEVDETDAQQPVLQVRGSIDMQSRADLIRVAQRSLAAGSVTTLVLDLTGVRFMDSTGIGALVELSRDAQEAQAGFRIRNPSSRVTHILELTGLLDAWDIETDAPPPVE